MSKISRIFGHAKFPIKKQCLRCNSRKLFAIIDGRLKCRRCRYIFSQFTGTPIVKSRLPLDAWYELIWWFVYEFTANKTAKETELPQRLVHRCFSTIRKAIHDYEETEMKKFFGEVEADETYIGPKFKNRRKKSRQHYRQINAVKRGRGAKNLQQPVFGLYQRNGTVYIKFVSDAGKKVIQNIIRGKIILESEIYTDTWTAYDGLKKKGYRHETIDHGDEEYFKQKGKKKIHINGIEGFWGYMKERLLKHHGVAKHNLIYYVKELEFRFNYRELKTEKMIEKIINILVKSGSPDD